METTTNRLSSAKWSRNLNQDIQSEANRLRLLERQRQLIESKLQRRQQEEHKNMNIVSTPSTTSTGGNVSSLSRPATAGIANLRGRSAVFSRQKSSTDLSSLDGDARDDQNSLDSSGGIDYDLELKKDTIRSNRARTSLPGNRTLISSLDSTATTRTFLNNKNNDSDNVTGFKANSNGSKPKAMVSGPLMNRSDSPKVKNFRDNRSLSKSEVNLNSALNGDGKNGNIEQTTVQSLINTKLPTPNPLQTVLTDSELLKFVSHPVSPDITLQCTIIRDKKGLDRSFYPTYYMHLQDIVPNNVATKSPMMEKSSKSNDGTGKVEGTATVWLSDSLESINSNDVETDQESLEAEPLKMANKNSLERDRNDQTFAGAKKVFVLSGRRRKKSKTYLIGNNAFDISREKCIAKLKSNVLGTQFTAIRLHQNGVRYEIASITYETNVLGFKGPRKMNIIIPKPDEKTNALCNLSLQEELKRNSRAILLLKNKTPIWNEETQSYVLNFHGRVTQASVKNFQLVVQDGKNGKNSEKFLDEMRRSASSQQLNHNQRFSNSNSNFDNDDDEDDDDEDGVDSGDEQFKRNKNNNNNNLQNHNSNLHSSGMQKSKSGYLTASSSEDAKQIADTDDLVSLQFGRVSNTNFSCDVSYPLSLLQAFAIALSSFDSKLACE